MSDHRPIKASLFRDDREGLHFMSIEVSPGRRLLILDRTGAPFDFTPEIRSARFTSEIEKLIKRVATSCGVYHPGKDQP